MDPLTLVQILEELKKIAVGVNNFWTPLAALATFVTAFVAWRSIRSLDIHRKDDFIPIVTIRSNHPLNPVKGGEMKILGKNVGKGIAKDVYLYMNNERIAGHFTLPADERELEMTAIYEIGDDLPDPLVVHVEYTDIFNREFHTVVNLVKMPEGYLIDDGSWYFEQVRGHKKPLRPSPKRIQAED